MTYFCGTYTNYSSKVPISIEYHCSIRNNAALIDNILFTIKRRG